MSNFIKDIKNIHKLSLSKKRKYFWGFTLIWTLFIYLINGEWLYFIPFLVGDIIFWKTINYTFWRKRKKETRKKRTWMQSWGDAILFAVIAAMLLRTFLIEAYTIPTPSMEKSLLVGDYLFVSKLNYGPRVPMTPLAFPLVHHTLPLVGGKSYSKLIQLPYYRMSGISKIERNDCVVFNWPAERLNRPIDKKENYIKRCVGIPGDKIKIKEGILFINGDPEENYTSKKNQRKYFVKTKRNLNIEHLYNKFDIYPSRNQDMLGDIEEVISANYDNHSKMWKIRTPSINNPDIPPYLYKNYFEEVRHSNDRIFIVNTTHKTFESLKKEPYIDEIFPAGAEKRNIFLDPWGSTDQLNPDRFLAENPYNWDAENYGPITVPKQGDIVKITLDNLPLYEPIIKRYEGEEMNEEENFENVIKEINKNGYAEYTIKMNYYWLMGDNRQNSADSRFWGYVPENHIVGKSLFIWMSYDKYGKGIRWSRMYKPWMWLAIIILFYMTIKKGIIWIQNKKQTI